LVFCGAANLSVSSGPRTGSEFIRKPCTKPSRNGRLH